MENKTNYNTTKQILMGVQAPSETNTYKPFTHAQVIDLTLEGLHQAGFKLEDELYTSAREGQVANARYVISNVADNEMKFQIGWQNSLNKSLSLKWASGVRIIICKNGVVNGDFGAFKKKHQGDIAEFSPKHISEYIKRAGDTFKQMQEQREAMKQVEIDESVTAHLVGEMFMNNDFITSTQLNIIKREIQVPSFDYGADNSLWQLYNHLTFSMKDIHPSLWMENHMQAHKFFVNQAGILVNSNKNEAIDEYHISPNQVKLEL